MIICHIEISLIEKQWHISSGKWKHIFQVNANHCRPIACYLSIAVSLLLGAYCRLNMLAMFTDFIVCTVLVHFQCFTFLTAVTFRTFECNVKYGDVVHWANFASIAVCESHVRCTQCLQSVNHMSDVHTACSLWITCRMYTLPAVCESHVRSTHCLQSVNHMSDVHTACSTME